MSNFSEDRETIATKTAQDAQLHQNSITAANHNYKYTSTRIALATYRAIKTHTVALWYTYHGDETVMIQYFASILEACDKGTALASTTTDNNDPCSALRHSASALESALETLHVLLANQRRMSAAFRAQKEPHRYRTLINRHRERLEYMIKDGVWFTMPHAVSGDYAADETGDWAEGALLDAVVAAVLFTKEYSFDEVVDDEEGGFVHVKLKPHTW